MKAEIEKILEAEAEAKRRLAQAEAEVGAAIRGAKEEAAQLLQERERQAHEEARRLVAEAQARASEEAKRLIDDAREKAQAHTDEAVPGHFPAVAEGVRKIAGLP